jgi:hypothetical protein
MKIILAGSRSIIDRKHVVKVIIKADWHITEVVSGGAKGVDTLGEDWAKINEIPIKCFPAEWSKYGKSAGYKRNEQMADYAEALIAIWDGKSRGTFHMINIARKKKLRVCVYIVD